MFSRTSLCLSALVAVLVSTSVSAQVTWQDERAASAAGLHYSRDIAGPAGSLIERGYLDVQPGSSLLRWTASDPVEAFMSGGSGLTEVTHDLPFDWPGGLVLGSAPPLFLVSGTNSSTGHGWLQYVGLAGDALGPRSISVVASSNLGVDCDPRDIYWYQPASTLFVVDVRDQELKAAEWDGGPFLPSAFSTVMSWVDPQFAPDGATLNLSSVVMEQDANSVVFPLGNLAGGLAMGGRWIEVARHDALSPWFATVVDTPLLERPVEIASLNYLSSLEVVKIRSVDKAVSVEFVDRQTEAVLYSVALSPSTSYTDIPIGTFTSMMPVDIHVGGVKQGSFTAIRRHSAPGSNAFGARFAMLPGSLGAEGPFIGADGFIVRSGLYLDPSDVNVPSIEADVFLWVGFETGAPPTQSASGIDLMANPITTLVAGRFGVERSRSTRVFAPFPIPMDSSLVGLAPIFQWVSAPVGYADEVAVSDVFGSPITSGPCVPPETLRSPSRSDDISWALRGMAGMRATRAVVHEVKRRLLRR